MEPIEKQGVNATFPAFRTLSIEYRRGAFRIAGHFPNHFRITSARVMGFFWAVAEFPHPSRVTPARIMGYLVSG